MAVDKAYSQAASSGLYAKPTGLRGKYDNVRRFWEDEATRLFFRPYLQELMEHNPQKKVRILDIGCGCGDGFDLLCGIRQSSVELSQAAPYLLPQERIEEYRGLDINPQLLEQGACQYANNGKVGFSRVDFLQGLGLKEQKPYDIFLANYGTLSHCSDEEVVRLLCEIARESHDGALFIGDWLGSFCYEWQNLWQEDDEEEQYIDYKISYIYEPEKRQELQLDSFPLRLMNEKSLRKLVAQVNKVSSDGIVIRKIFDRSLFVGRHMETAEYKGAAQPIRTLINSLLEPGVRTDFANLKITCRPREGFPRLNSYFNGLQNQWNAMVQYTEDFLCGQARNVYRYSNNVALSTMMQEMNILLTCAKKLQLEDVRANIIEPQLGYMLRNIEMNWSTGLGIGHGFGVVLEIKKQK
ncbi:class I SAM-dependent methyltransferase [Dethiobacter alkaliphilus]|uniref:class I SAM-dependent methyltransferase n=1 Tax=Dethiobacter alkaliphilus TaxID=427926 RepID=UPI0022268B92|nr:class I SAM-dependent methyltransferase [Dethiobacter alkaliphilus]MCW3490972.1 class I SAM-dependent methyltransferase [Dethiobacter alkaliphilus]